MQNVRPYILYKPIGTFTFNATSMWFSKHKIMISVEALQNVK